MKRTYLGAVGSMPSIREINAHARQVINTFRRRFMMENEENQAGGGRADAQRSEEQDQEMEEELQNPESIDYSSTEEENDSEEPFSSKETAYEDENIAVVVKKVLHKQNTQYSLEDSLYELKVETLKPDASPPLLISLEKGLRAGMVYLFNKLKGHYDETEHRQVYRTVDLIFIK